LASQGIAYESLSDQVLARQGRPDFPQPVITRGTSPMTKRFLVVKGEWKRRVYGKAGLFLD
jgi:hypothetical protein